MGASTSKIENEHFQAIGMDAEHSLYGFLIERTAKRYKQILQRLFHYHNFEITVDQWVILNRIDQDGSIYSNDLAQQVMKDAPTVTRILDILEQKNLVKRTIDSTDRRKTSLTLSKKGKELVQQVRPVVIEMRKDGWKGLTDNDLKKLQSILDTIYENVNGISKKAKKVSLTA